MATTLDGVTVADPLTPTTREKVITGIYRETLNGTTVLDYTNIKWKWAISWGLLTQAEYNVILAKLELTTTFVFSPPNVATTYTVMSLQDTYREEMVNSDDDGTPRYYIDIELIESV